MNSTETLDRELAGFKSELRSRCPATARAQRDIADVERAMLKLANSGGTAAAWLEVLGRLREARAAYRAAANHE